MRGVDPFSPTICLKELEFGPPTRLILYIHLYLENCCLLFSLGTKVNPMHFLAKTDFFKQGFGRPRHLVTQP